MGLDISKLKNSNGDLDMQQISTMGIDVSKLINSVGALDIRQILPMGLDVYKSRNSVRDRTSGRVQPRILMSPIREILLETGHLTDFNYGS